MKCATKIIKAYVQTAKQRDHKVTRKPLGAWNFIFYVWLHTAQCIPVKKGQLLSEVLVSWISTKSFFLMAKVGWEKHLWGKLWFDSKYWCLQDLGDLCQELV